MNTRTNQLNYLRTPIAKDKLMLIAEREKRAIKILAVLKDHYGSTLHCLNLLDISCSTGFMAKRFGESVRLVVGMDIDRTALAVAANLDVGEHVKFVASDALKTCFYDSFFDIVVCNQMYEHVPSAEKLMKEIYRILKPDGVCYFGATNRLKIIETHYGNIPFLSYLPKKIANIVIKKLGRGDEYYETLYTEWGLKALVKNFTVTDYTKKIISNPKRFSAENLIKPGSLKQKVALMVMKYAYPFLPGYVWLLSKKTN
jgi:ubiquinone/menaquinone biosynthesis C-methylase UbiE